MKLDFSQLTFIKPDTMKELSDAMDKFEINTPLRAAHFLAQAKEESANFTKLSENLNYSAQALLATWPKHFADISTANAYARQPAKIANHAYANRGGNGDELSGDGWNFRGRGYFELTEKNNYIAFGNSIGIDLISNPDLVANRYPGTSAAWFFSSHGLNHLADAGGSDANVQAITKVINGGLKGITDRVANFHQIFPLIKIPNDKVVTRS